jgi:hypothetical protein
LSLAQASRVHPLTVIHPLSYTHNRVIQPSVRQYIDKCETSLVRQKKKEIISSSRAW